MSWDNRGTYWAWKGKDEDFCPPPTIKTIHYAQIPHLGMSLAIGVWDDDKYTELNRAEYEWLISDNTSSSNRT